MPWTESTKMDEKNAFIDLVLQKEHSLAECARRFGICEKTAHKWLRRYDAEGRAGLCERSRARHHRAQRFSSEAKAVIVALKREYPPWGARKLRVIAERRYPELSFPSHMSIYTHLKSQGLCGARKKRARPQAEHSPFWGYYGPNACWAADYKGEFALANKRLCYPLTISDIRSRYLLGCQALPHTRSKRAKMVFHRAFCEYGLPDIIRTDNGVPFASSAPGGLSELSIWWIRLGITPHRIQPGRPTQNSRHERIHKIMLDECHVQENFRQQQTHFDVFRKRYNTLRPHEALNNKTPADIYCESTKRYPCKDKDPVYPEDYFVERVDASGGLRFAASAGHLSKLLAGQIIGLQRIEQRSFDCYFGPIYLGRLTHKGFKRKTAKQPKPTTTHLPM